MRGATSSLNLRALPLRFQPTRPLRGATVRRLFRAVVRLIISTHAPLAGRDNVATACVISPKKFQPTRPLRGATVTKSTMATNPLHFNPRAPCGARLLACCKWERFYNISTHAPLAGRDDGYEPQDGELPFISTHAPLAGRDQTMIMTACRLIISTHAPLAGRDSKSVQITMHIFAITDKFQMLLHRMPPVRAFCSFLMQENHADFGCEPPK